MKKMVTVLLGATLMGGLFSCGKAGLGANVEVKVSNLLNMPVKEKVVYLFKDKDPLTLHLKPEDAQKHVITDNNGVALFHLNFVDFDILESQTSLYFGVYYTVGGNDYLAGSSAITVQRGDQKRIDLKIPL